MFGIHMRRHHASVLRWRGMITGGHVLPPCAMSCHVMWTLIPMNSSLTVVSCISEPDSCAHLRERRACSCAARFGQAIVTFG